MSKILMFTYKFENNRGNWSDWYEDGTYIIHQEGRELNRLWKIEDNTLYWKHGIDDYFTLWNGDVEANKLIKLMTEHTVESILLGEQ